MELLRKYLFLIILIIVTLPTLHAQNKGVVKAFSNSYDLEKEGKYIEATAVLKNVYNEDSYEINLRLGWLYYLAGKYSVSELYYSKAINIVPYAIEPKFGMVYPKAALAKWDEVVVLYNNILKIDANNTVANYRLGNIYYYRKQYDKAKHYYEKVLNLYPFDYDTLLMMGWTYLQLKQSVKAKVLFNKVLMYSPKDKSANDGLKILE